MTASSSRFPEDLRRTYDPQRELGRGGFGTVWLAEQTSLGRRVALKLLHSIDEANQVERFQQEAQVTARLSHPHIVEIIDHGTSEGLPWIAYEFIEGRSLRERLQDGPLSIRMVIEIGIQVASALRYSHQEGVGRRGYSTCSRPEGWTTLRKMHARR